MKPIIGIVARSKKNEFDKSILVVDSKVSEAVTKLGGIPFMILPTQGIDYETDTPNKIKRLTEQDKMDLERILNLCDGIIMPGGSKWFEFDEYISKYAVDNDIPLLGICAGMQLLAKTLNNNRIDGLDNTIQNDGLIDHNQARLEYVHRVDILKDSLLYEILKKESIEVNSRHKYHIPLELSFIASSYSEDGLIESVEYKDNKFTLGIQWHPESMIDYDEDAVKIISAFIEKSRVKKIQN